LDFLCGGRRKRRSLIADLQKVKGLWIQEPEPEAELSTAQSTSELAGQTENLRVDGGKEESMVGPVVQDQHGKDNDSKLADQTEALKLEGRSEDSNVIGAKVQDQEKQKSGQQEEETKEKEEEGAGEINSPNTSGSGGSTHVLKRHHQRSQ
jgi:hypothetical protein